MNEITIISPATVANVSCGFDVLGFCLSNVGDIMTVRKTAEKGIKISKIEGYDLPYDTNLNVASVSALALYQKAKPNFGFEIEIIKKIKPGSGIGSSAASAVGSVFAINQLLGIPFNKTELTEFAIKGEAMASKSEHADNLAPAIFGGFTLVKSVSPLEILEIPSPNNLFATIIHPQIEVKTSEARSILPKEIPLQNAIKQWANFGSLIHALHECDYDLIKSSLEDVVIEPYRKQLIPKFDSVKEAASKAGALGLGISGSGPSMFALSEGKGTANQVLSAVNKIYSETKIDFQSFVSDINKEGIKILNKRNEI